jgi:hypothetical protein
VRYEDTLLYDQTPGSRYECFGLAITTPLVYLMRRPLTGCPCYIQSPLTGFQPSMPSFHISISGIMF